MGAGAKHRLVFVDRLLATLVHLRHAVTHVVPRGSLAGTTDYGPHTAIRTSRGPTRLHSTLFRPLPQVRGEGQRVPRADEESAGVVLAEEAGLLLNAGRRAPDLGSHPPGALHSACCPPSPACTPTPGSALGYLTLADALPLAHGPLDEAVCLLSKAVKKLGTVAEEDLETFRQSGADGCSDPFVAVPRRAHRAQQRHDRAEARRTAAEPRGRLEPVAYRALLGCRVRVRWSPQRFHRGIRRGFTPTSSANSFCFFRMAVRSNSASRPIHLVTPAMTVPHRVSPGIDRYAFWSCAKTGCSTGNSVPSIAARGRRPIEVFVAKAAAIPSACH